ncbi:hypothetical protein [Canibacter zhoujuaniae]|uniref:hypothetical protein n=1 Tax=Canibacter zhoujuaniae TaxID=2708343 RepID=UPI0014216359|nr:hypothetical protein [Canibacter zhoujuaniae]
MIAVSSYMLIDSSCAVTGYVEDLCGNLCADSESIALQCRKFGVAAIRDTGSGIAASFRFNANLNPVRLIGGTVTITDSTPLSRSEIVIANRSQLDGIVSLCLATGERWIGVRSSRPDFFQAVWETANPKGISVSGRGSGALKATRLGHVQIIDGVAALLPSQSSPREALTSASNVKEDSWSELTNTLLEHGVPICTGLVSLRRAVFLKEAIQAPYLQELSSIVPHTRYLQQMRQGMGYLTGKRALEAHSGMREPTGKERQGLDKGWERLVGWIGNAAQAGVIFLPASKAPQLAVIPGYGLLEELALLAHIGISAADTVTLATTTAAEIFGIQAIPGKLAIRRAYSKNPAKENTLGATEISELNRDSLLSLTPAG